MLAVPVVREVEFQMILLLNGLMHAVERGASAETFDSCTIY